MILGRPHRRPNKVATLTMQIKSGEEKLDLQQKTGKSASTLKDQGPYTGVMNAAKNISSGFISSAINNAVYKYNVQIKTK